MLATFLLLLSVLFSHGQNALVGHGLHLQNKMTPNEYKSKKVHQRHVEKGALTTSIEVLVNDKLSMNKSFSILESIHEMDANVMAGNCPVSHHPDFATDGYYLYPNEQFNQNGAPHVEEPCTTVDLSNNKLIPLQYKCPLKPNTCPVLTESINHFTNKSNEWLPRDMIPTM